jgi:hypothetical protein
MMGSMGLLKMGSASRASTTPTTILFAKQFDVVILFYSHFSYYPTDYELIIVQPTGITILLVDSSSIWGITKFYGVCCKIHDGKPTRKV